MSKKMFDILPPKEAGKVENTIKEMGLDRKRDISKPEEFKKPKKERRFPLKEIAIGGVVILFLLVAYGATKLPKADISIWPKMNTLTLSEKITADKSIDTVSLKNQVIPAMYMEEQKDSWQSFPATGSASNDGRAMGAIKVYNKTTTDFTLIKGTHFLSDSGKYFVTLEKITIPAAKKGSAGSISVKVQAEESGTAYNIGPSKFSAPKLQGTSYYYSIYGESTDAMSGGYTGNVKKVTEDDIKQAKDSLTKKLLQDAKDSLKGRLAADDILLDSSIESSVIDASSDVKAGAVIDNFNESAKVKVLALVFKKQDVEKFVKDNIASQLPETNNFLPQSLHIDYSPETVDMKKGKLTINVKSSVNTYYDMNTGDLVALFKTKSGDQIKEILDQMYSGKISELKINFWPFWVHKAPDNKDKIKVNLLFDK